MHRLKNVVLFVSAWAILTTAFTSVVMWYGVSKCGSYQGWISFIQGRRLIARPIKASLGQVDAGSDQRVRFTLQNFRRQDRQILGIKPSCSCMVTEDPPARIPANDSVNIDVKVRVPSGPGPFEEEVAVITDDGQQPMVHLRVDGRAEAKIVAAASP